MSDSAGSDEYGLVGRVLLDRYRIDSWLGRGGMATVYLAHDVRLERRVVVKVPRLDILTDAGQRQRFLAEVQDLSRYEHPHILGILDEGETEGVPFAVLQYLGGGDLSARLRDLPDGARPTDVLDWLRPVARALDFIHSKGCLHRDVKPANILFDEQGHPFLSDFGISTALDVIDSEAPTVALKDQLTTAGMFVGSPAYAPPEAIDRVFTPAYDQYALATVVYVALAGSLPFSGRTNEAMLIAKSKAEPSPLPQSGRALPAACERVLRRALSRDPDDRFESCQAFVDAFEAAGRPQAPGSRRLLFAAAGAVGLGVALFLLVLIDPLGDRPGATETHALAAASTAVELGSTEAETAAAQALCAEFGGHCEAEELLGETLHVYEGGPVVIDRYEITNEEFAEFVAAERLTTLAEERGFSWDGPTKRYGASWRRPGGDIVAAREGRLPVVHISQDEAARFCAWRGGRLPTADEWEFAARGPDRRIFPWGDTWDETRLRAIGAPGYGLEAVGSHPTGATPDGIDDLAGSVWEWTASVDGDGHLIKGGSWDTPNPAYFRSAGFASIESETTSSDVGFRCVRDAD